MPARSTDRSSTPEPIASEAATPVWVPGTFTEMDFRKALSEAVNGHIVFSDSTPWTDLTRALLAIAVSPRPVPKPLVENARAVYLRHLDAAA